MGPAQMSHIMEHMVPKMWENNEKQSVSPRIYAPFSMEHHDLDRSGNMEERIEGSTLN